MPFLVACDTTIFSIDVCHELTMCYHFLAAIEISDEEAEKVFSVGDAVQFISKALDVH